MRVVEGREGEGSGPKYFWLEPPLDLKYVPSSPRDVNVQHTSNGELHTSMVNRSVRPAQCAPSRQRLWSVRVLLRCDATPCRTRC